MFQTENICWPKDIAHSSFADRWWSHDKENVNRCLWIHLTITELHHFKMSVCWWLNSQQNRTNSECQFVIHHQFSKKYKFKYATQLAHYVYQKQEHLQTSALHLISYLLVFNFLHAWIPGFGHEPQPFAYESRQLCSMVGDSSVAVRWSTAHTSWPLPTAWLSKYPTRLPWKGFQMTKHSHIITLLAATQ